MAQLKKEKDGMREKHSAGKEKRRKQTQRTTSSQVEKLGDGSGGEHQQTE